MNEPREGRWLAKPLKRRKTLFDVALFITLPFYAFSFHEWRFGHTPMLVETLVAAAFVVAILVAIVGMPIHEAWRRRRSRRDRAFSDQADGAEEYAVEIVVQAKRHRPGVDRGVAWFDGSLLGFSGERCSFLLSALDLQAPNSEALSHFDLPYLPLKLGSGGEKGRLTICPLWGSAVSFRRELKRFLLDREDARGERQWPPLEPYQEEKVDEPALRV